MGWPLMLEKNMSMNFIKFALEPYVTSCFIVKLPAGRLKGWRMKRYWKVGELAKLTGLTVRTLRFYDQTGLFSPSGKTEGGHRLYGESDLSRLQQILSLKELGLSLEEVNSVLEGGEFSPLDIVELQKARIKEQIKLQQNLLEQLEHASKLLQAQRPLSAQDFANLLQAMKIEHQKVVVERQKSWERHLDLLGHFLSLDNQSRQTESEEE